MREISPAALDRLVAFEADVCQRLNRLTLGHPAFLALLRAASRLGDGFIWLGIVVLLAAVEGRAAGPVLAQMAVLAAVCLTLYKGAKHLLARERPSTKHPSIALLVAPLDRYSFPSGHTLHAVAFSLVLCQTYPVLAWLLVPFTVLVALSRVLLGAHYPSDVLAGALIGALLALGSFALFA